MVHNGIDILLILVWLIGASYFILIVLFTIGWFRLKPLKHDHSQLIRASIIVAMRNEEDNILNLLQDLKMQSHKEFNLIIIDDHSEDKSYEFVHQFMEANPQMKMQLLKAENEGKKSAIQQGVSLAKSEIIISTDADCRPGPKWVSCLVNTFEADIHFVSAPVLYINEQSLFEKFQSLEFLSLIASGAGAIGIGMPIMCNGANLAYRREIFDRIRAYGENKNISSGDDVFLLHKIKKEFGSSAIRFIKDRNAIVKTNGLSGINDFFAQRKRWASKSTAYKDRFTIFTALMIGCMNVLLIYSFILGICHPMALKLGFIGLLVKVVVDFGLLFSAAQFFKKRSLMIYYLPLQILYPLYISLIGILSFFTKNRWKGRRI